MTEMILDRYDVEFLVRNLETTDPHRPNFTRAVAILARLIEWTDSNSDGWAYWSKPRTAAGLLAGTARAHSRFAAWPERRDEDLTDADLKRALTPIKAFLTRQGVAPDTKRRILGEVA